MLSFSRSSAIVGKMGAFRHNASRKAENASVRHQKRRFTTQTQSTSSEPSIPKPPQAADPRMLITTGSFLYGRKVLREVALVSGSSVRAKNVLYDLLSRVSGFFGWEVTFYSTLLSETSSQAVERMIAEAAALGADAIINVKFTMSSTSDPTAGVFVYTMTYGTAVLTEEYGPEGAQASMPGIVKTRSSGMPSNPL